MDLCFKIQQIPQKQSILKYSATTGTNLIIASTQSTTQTISFPNITGSDTVATLAMAQTFTGNQTWSGSNTMNGLLNFGSTGVFQMASVIYNTGTVGESTTTITGSGTTFTKAMIGGVIVFGGASNYTNSCVITAYTSATSITVNKSQTIASSTSYIIYYGGLVGISGYTLLVQEIRSFWTMHLLQMRPI